MQIPSKSFNTKLIFLNSCVLATNDNAEPKFNTDINDEEKRDKIPQPINASRLNIKYHN